MESPEATNYKSLFLRVLKISTPTSAVISHVKVYQNRNQRRSEISTNILTSSPVMTLGCLLCRSALRTDMLIVSQLRIVNG